jgi:hypothetical protein
MGDEVEFIKDGKKPRKFKWQLYLGLVFMGLLLFIGYTSFFNPDLVGLMGNIVGIDKSEIVDGVKLEARLGVPEELIINSYASKLSVRVNENVEVSVGDGKISLGKGDSVIIDDFQGLVDVDGKMISELNGRGSKVFVDGLPIIHKSDEMIDVELSGGYGYLGFEGLYLDYLSYVTSGSIRINDDKVVIKLSDEKFEFNKFQGNFVVSNEVRMKGVIDRSNVKGLLESYGKLEEKFEDNPKDEDNA